MVDINTKLESKFFNQHTTNRNDYQRNGTVGTMARNYAPTVYKPKKSCLAIRPPPLKDVHTMSNWKSAVVPFSLMHKPKDIIGTSPNQTLKAFEKPIVSGPGVNLDIQKTRPRLVMTPAVSMDDIDDNQTRDVLIKDLYTTDASKSQRQAVAKYIKVETPLTDQLAPSNPVVLAKLNPPIVSMEWRMETVSWDSKQLRLHCDPSREFWTGKDLSKCNACEETDIVKSHRKMKPQLK